MVDGGKMVSWFRFLAVLAHVLLAYAHSVAMFINIFPCSIRKKSSVCVWQKFGGALRFCLKFGKFTITRFQIWFSRNICSCPTKVKENFTPPSSFQRFQICSDIVFLQLTFVNCIIHYTVDYRCITWYSFLLITNRSALPYNKFVSLRIIK